MRGKTEQVITKLKTNQGEYREVEWGAYPSGKPKYKKQYFVTKVAPLNALSKDKLSLAEQRIKIALESEQLSLYEAENLTLDDIEFLFLNERAYKLLEKENKWTVSEVLKNRKNIVALADYISKADISLSDTLKLRQDISNNISVFADYINSGNISLKDALKFSQEKVEIFRDHIKPSVDSDSVSFHDALSLLDDEISKTNAFKLMFEHGYSLDFIRKTNGIKINEKIPFSDKDIKKYLESGQLTIEEMSAFQFPYEFKEKKEAVQAIEKEVHAYSVRVSSVLDRMKSKADNLRERGYIEAAQQADSLRTGIQEQLNVLNQSKTNSALQNFKNASTAVVNQNSSLLKEHRGFVKVLADILAVISGGLSRRFELGLFKSASSKLIDETSSLLEEEQSKEHRLS